MRNVYGTTGVGAWTPDEHARLGDLFLAVCDLDPASRATFLDTACGKDTRLRQAVEALIEEDSCIRRLIERTERSADDPEAGGMDRWAASDSVSPALLQRREVLTGPLAQADGEVLPAVPGYELIERIGQGGMGVVFRAVQRELQRTVALKILPASISAARPELVERFRREASAAGRLRHKNIVPVYDFGAAACGHFYSMQWIAGCSLDILVNRLARARGDDETCAVPSSQADVEVDELGVLTPQERPFRSAYFRRLVGWMLDALDALGYAHRHGVLHRDIKPGNLIVAADGRVMVADFGLAKLELDVSMTSAHAVMGTLRYLSPEQLFGKRVPIDGRADLYSLGATFYELLTLQPLFGNRSQEQLVSSIITQEPQSPRSIRPEVPRDLETICLKMLQKMPEARYTATEDVEYDLAAYLDGRPLKTKPPGVATRVVRSVRRVRGKWALAVAVLVALVAVSLQISRWRRARVDARVAELVGQGLVAQQDHRWKDADADYRAAIELDPLSFRALGNLAIVLKERYNASQEKEPALLEEAATLCNRALDVNPGSAGLWNVLGVLYKMTGDLADAAEAYRAAVEIDDQHPESKIAALNNLAEVYWLSGEWSAAEASLRASAKLASDTQTPAWYTFCDLAALELFYDDPAALDAIQTAFDQKAEPGWRLHLIRARIHLELTGAVDPESALRDALVARELSTPDAQIERTLAMAYLRSERWTEATSAADTAVDLGDIPSFPLLIAGLAEAHADEHEAAAARLERADELWPGVLSGRGYHVTTERGMLWFDKESSLLDLRNELEVLLDGD